MYHTQLSQQIAELNDQLAYSRQLYQDAGAALALAPADTELKAKARAAKAKIAELVADLELLNDSKGSALSADAVQAEEDLRNKARTHLAAAKALVAKRAKLAADFDKQLAALKSTGQAWGDSSTELAQTVRSFYKITARGLNSSTVEMLQVATPDLERAPGNNVMAQFDEAVRPLNIANKMVMNYRTANGTPGLVVDGVAKADHGVIYRMDNTAESQGLL